MAVSEPEVGKLYTLIVFAMVRKQVLYGVVESQWYNEIPSPRLLLLSEATCLAKRRSDLFNGLTTSTVAWLVVSTVQKKYGWWLGYPQQKTCVFIYIYICVACSLKTVKFNMANKPIWNDLDML